MKVAITGRHTTVTPALRQYLAQRFHRLSRYGMKLERGQFVLSVEKYRHAAEGVVSVDGRIIQGKVATREMYVSIDRLLEKIERQLLKNKEKIVERKLRKRPTPGAQGMDPSSSAMTPIETMRVPAPVLTIEEALGRLEARRNAFLVFRNTTTGHLQVVQRTDDGQMRLIDAGT